MLHCVALCCSVMLQLLTCTNMYAGNVKAGDILVEVDGYPVGVYVCVSVCARERSMERDGEKEKDGYPAGVRERGREREREGGRE